MHQLSYIAKQGWYYLRSTKMISIVILTIVVLDFTLAGDTALYPHRASRLTTAQTSAINGAGQRITDKQGMTPSSPIWSENNTNHLQIAPFFVRYYLRHGAANCLGEPITPVFPTRRGWLQFFQFSALLLPDAHPSLLPAPQDITFTPIQHASRNTTTGIIALPLVQALLTIGARIPIGGKGSNLTYANLRHATLPGFRQAPPAAKKADSYNRRVFIKTGTRGKMVVGHFIAQAFWQYITSKNNAPNGWYIDFGSPLTETLAFTFWQKKVIHHMQIQVFAHSALLRDRDIPATSKRPAIQRLATGQNYLSAIGPPTMATNIQKTIWTPLTTALLSSPGAHQALAHVGKNFDLKPLGATRWTKGRLWYQVQWSVPKGRRTGWVAADTTSIDFQKGQASWSSFDVLSPSLAAYLAKQGNNVSALVYDITHQRYYNYRGTNLSIAASSIKVPIMLTFLDMVERQNRMLTSSDLMLLTTMIENSDNDSASVLYYDNINGAIGLSAYMQRIGIGGIQADTTSWGYSLISPEAMVNLLAKLNAGTILNASHRQLALTLMRNIEPDQRTGVGDTAPPSASVAMKNGWVIAPNNLWVMNTSGIVTLPKETYIVSVYTQNQLTLEAGQNIVSMVCANIAALLT